MNYGLELAQKYKPSKAGEKVKSVGYFFWGFMSDIRMKNGKAFSSPDGSLLHAFSIVYELNNRGIDVYRLGVNRDAEYYYRNEDESFRSFSQEKRLEAYLSLIEPNHYTVTGKLNPHWPDVDVVLLEWRMPTRYNQLGSNDPEFEPDMLLQNLILLHYQDKGVPIICLDLDYKMRPNVDDQFFHFVFEPGFKRGPEHHIDVPYVLQDINQFVQENPRQEIVYIGNRYERDAEFDLFFGNPSDSIEFKVYGNWLERGKDSQERWPYVKFNERIQPCRLHDAYKYALCTPLLLKPEYNQNGFMSIRVIESLLFGTIPVLPKQFQSPIEYDFWRVENQEEMVSVAKSMLFTDPELRQLSRDNAIKAIQQHDVKYFVNKFLSVL